MEIIFGVALFAFIIFAVYRIEYGKPTNYVNQTVFYNGDEFLFEFWTDTSFCDLPYLAVKKRLPDKHFLGRTFKQYLTIKSGWTEEDRVERCWEIVAEYYAEIEARNAEAAHVKEFCGD